MSQLHLIAVGKLKDPHLEKLENMYLKRIHTPSLKIHEVKSHAESKDQEAENILKKLKELQKSGERHQVILLTEHGQEYDSPSFARKVVESKLLSGPCITFVIAGAEGPASKLLEQGYEKLSLSRMTFPHKLARILLVEQIYRAQCIRSGHPYHN